MRHAVSRFYRYCFYRLYVGDKKSKDRDSRIWRALHILTFIGYFSALFCAAMWEHAFGRGVLAGLFDSKLLILAIYLSLVAGQKFFLGRGRRVEAIRAEFRREQSELMSYAYHAYILGLPLLILAVVILQ